MIKKVWLVLLICVFAGFLLLGFSVYQGQLYEFAVPGFLGWDLNFALDGFRAVLCILTAFIWLLTTIVSPEQMGNTYSNWLVFFSFLTFGAVLGVFLSADFFTTYVFFEIMTFASYAMIIMDGSKKALQGGAAYLTFGIVGGLAMLLGMAGLYNVAGTLEFSRLLEVRAGIGQQRALWISGLLIFFGFAVKSGVFPVHITLAPAYDSAQAPVSAVLSGILSKTGVFGLVVLSIYVFGNQPLWGLMLVFFGLLTMFAGAVLAIFNVQLKRILAYSSMSQIGFILLGTGMIVLLGHHNALAVRGSFLHMVNHSLVKLVFFIAVGIIAANADDLDLNNLRGCGRGRPLLHSAFLAGAFGIGGVPFFNGYISKTLLHESLLEYLHELPAAGSYTMMFKLIEILFIIAGGLTVAYITKIYLALFRQNPSEKETTDSRSSIAAVAFAAILLPIIGSVPHLADMLADLGEGFMQGIHPDHHVHYFAWVNLKGAVYSMFIGAIVYLGFIRTFLMERAETGEWTYYYKWPQNLDLTENFYKPLILNVLPAAGGIVAQNINKTGKLLYDIMMALIAAGTRLTNMVFNSVDFIVAAWKMMPAGLNLAELLFYIGKMLLTLLQILVQLLFIALIRLINAVNIVTAKLINWLQYFIYRLTGRESAYVPYTAKLLEWQPVYKTIKQKAAVDKNAATAQIEKKEQRKIMQGIESGISYSLLLFGLGLIITVVYLLNLF